MELNLAQTPACSPREGVEYIHLAGGSLGSGMLADLRSRLDGCRASVIVLSATGPQVGFDLTEVCAAASRSDLTPARFYADCLLSIREADATVIASVNGKAMGGSVGLIAACDIVIANAGSVFQLPEVIGGMVPALVGPILARRIGRARAGYLALSSRPIDAREAHTMRLVDEVAELALETCVERQVRRILRSSPAALSEFRKHERDLAGRALRAELEAAILWQARWLAEPGVRETILEFADGLALN